MLPCKFAIFCISLVVIQYATCFTLPSIIITQGRTPRQGFPNLRAWRTTKSIEIALERELIDEVSKFSSRGKDATSSQTALVNRLISDLEKAGENQKYACSDSIDGKWKLIYTSTPSTASPIQRSFFGVNQFSIFQIIDIYSSQRQPTVSNVVDFGDKIGQLKVDAIASTYRRPLPNFTPRRGDGRIFGLNILGVSKTADEATPMQPEARIDFKFDSAGFEFKALPFRIPYPVPFRQLGDEVKGWIDVTYLSKSNDAGGIRISRGNKGTTFVLVREC